ncbi:MAG: hypothetical protein Q8K24_07035 [Hydrogenophaga sp.]|nr:hypothetical protein [Hydrogenophaga sp.]
MDAAAFLTLRPAKRAALRTARQRLTLARGPVGLSLGAALTEPLPRTPRQWGALLLLAALPLLLVVALSHWLLMGWHAVLLGWAPRLGLPLERGASDALVWRALDAGALPGGPLVLAVAALAVLAVFTASLWLPARHQLGRRLLWALCAVQAVAVLLAVGRPDLLPQSPTAYLSTLLHAGFYLMLTLPVLLALGLSALKMGWAARLGFMAAVLAYFALMLPHKMLLLALLFQWLPMVWAPLLFVLLGVVADLLVFLALFAVLSVSRPVAR